MPLVKFISPADPKWLSTLDALTAPAWCPIRRSAGTAHGPARTGARRGRHLLGVLVWYVEALARAGRLDEARPYKTTQHLPAVLLFSHELIPSPGR
jgi:GH15 family glucan-1,4-alpha-glucosidase